MTYMCREFPCKHGVETGGPPRTEPVFSLDLLLFLFIACKGGKRFSTGGASRKVANRIGNFSDNSDRKKPFIETSRVHTCTESRSGSGLLQVGSKTSDSSSSSEQ